MFRFFVESEQLNQEPIIITGEDYNHIRNVLRMRTGDKVLLCDGSDKEYEAEIIGFTDDVSQDTQRRDMKNYAGRNHVAQACKHAVLCRITDVFGNARELPARITLFQGYPKGDKMEQIVQKAVELGVCEIVPVMMNRCVVKLDEKKASKKVERLNGIALSAAKQSKRGMIPGVADVMTFKQALDYAKGLECVIIPYECAEGMDHSRRIMQDAVSHSSIGIFIGPEGGFEQSEIDGLSEIGGNTISLGHRILRTETAGMAVLSILMYMLEK